MRIAFTGSSSTGKTTLIRELFKLEEFKKYELRHVTTDARKILDSLGFKQMDLMTKQETRNFQKLYFEKKIEIELDEPRLIVERSFVDVASYWLVRDHSNNINHVDSLINDSSNYSRGYDLHFYFPTGVIPFEDDGYRSKNEIQRKKVDQQILQFLEDWKIKYIPINLANIQDRVSLVLANLRTLKTANEE